jgi:hypothetical protein
MAYFNHAFRKTLVATKGNQGATTPGSPGGTAGVTGGILQTAGLHTSVLKSTSTAEGYQLGPGVVGYFDAKTDLSLENLSETCPFYLAAASIKLKDKQGPFHGGYQTSTKTKVINPKYLRKVWMVESNAATRAVLEIGGTPDNVLANAACNKEFICEETYYLRLEAKGTAALRFANHNLYQNLSAYGGCCVDPAAPAAVDPVGIYLQFAEQLAGVPGSDQAGDTGNPYLRDFIRPLISVTFDSGTGNQSGVYAQNEEIALEEGLTALDTWANMPREADAGTTIVSAGLILVGAYEDTEFADCTFQPSDYYGKSPIQIFASEVDLNGDPCAFEGMCVTTVCEGVQANGLGESVVRDLILSESYLQNFMATDLRIREITQGTSTLDIIDRFALYGRFFILHVVPRFNNPSGVFDNDQYLIDVVGDDDTLSTMDADFGGLLKALGPLAGCEEVEDLSVEGCTYTLPVVPPAP